MPAKAFSRIKGLADLASLAPQKKKPKSSTAGAAAPGSKLLQVIVETPRGSRNKYSYDKEQRCMVLKSVLPAGMVFPHDFGFLPATQGGDGDPLDVLVLSDEPCFPGCAVLARLIGVMEAEQTQNGETFRNDRLLAVAEPSDLYRHLHTVEDLPSRKRAELSAFFISYHELQGKGSRTLAWKGPRRARTLIDRGSRLARRTSSKVD